MAMGLALRSSLVVFGLNHSIICVDENAIATNSQRVVHRWNLSDINLNLPQHFICGLH